MELELRSLSTLAFCGFGVGRSHNCNSIFLFTQSAGALREMSAYIYW
ncbi:hypothetical protein ACF3DV_16635 [Chlorogloeopsis fritschii PCC 9212]|nr:hypothetical protein [Chlorogloeopsis fritschii]